MSKKLGANITCPACKNVFPTELYRTIWAENPENRSLILDDKINAVTCPRCKHHERLQFPFLCTNVKRGFALWYEPHPDPQIDKDMADYRKHMGAESFYSKAPRISDWETFKEKLLEMEANAPTEASMPSPSPEMQEKWAGFIASLKEQNKTKKTSSKGGRSHDTDSSINSEETEVSDKKQNLTTIKDIEKQLESRGIYRPLRMRFKTQEEHQDAMDRWHQIIKHTAKGMPRGVKKTEAREEDGKSIVTYKFVISRSAVQFRPLAPYKTIGYGFIP